MPDVDPFDIDPFDSEEWGQEIASIHVESPDLLRLFSELARRPGALSMWGRSAANKTWHQQTKHVQPI